LHSSTAGRKFGRSDGPLQHTENLSERLVRLPLWIGMDQSIVERIASTAERALV
jgi:dTDP-4-amino-4,6-dideoxygalactose transaminase